MYTQVHIRAHKNATADVLLSGTPVVDWFSGDKPLVPSAWSAELSRLSVLVLEARSFLNLLNDGSAKLEDLDMLVRGVRGGLLFSSQSLAPFGGSKN